MGEKTLKKLAKQVDSYDYSWVDSLVDSKRPRYSDSQSEYLTYLENKVCERLHGRRLLHSLRVARTSELLAMRYGVDPYLAKAAGYLHDWDKQITKEELWEKAFAFNVVPKDVDPRIEPLLHAWTAAASLPEEFPELPQEVFCAIGRHTIGAVDMAPLDIVVNVGDLLEPGREYKELEVIRKYIATQPLETVFAESLRDSLISPIQRGKYLYPGAVDIWNVWCKKLIDAE